MKAVVECVYGELNEDSSGSTGGTSQGVSENYWGPGCVDLLFKMASSHQCINLEKRGRGRDRQRERERDRERTREDLSSYKDTNSIMRTLPTLFRSNYVHKAHLQAPSH